MARHVGIIGGGIVGVSAAHRLLQDGWRVTLIEAEPDARPASDGNAGLLAFPEVAPLCSPATLASAPRWLFDPLGPLALRWRDVPTLAPWLARFALASLPAASRRSGRHLTQLLTEARGAFLGLHAGTGLADPVTGSGYLAIHDTPGALDRAAAEAQQTRTNTGQDYARLTPEEARKIVPQLEGRFAGAIRHDGYLRVDDPALLRRRLLSALRERGSLTVARVRRIETSPSTITVATSVGPMSFDRVLVANGLAARDILRPLGLTVPLETERGYNTTFSAMDWTLAIPLGFAAHGFVATPLASGLRVGGAVELARPEAPQNPARARALVGKMRRYVPSLPQAGGTEWMGRRPSTPDCIPVISRHPREPRVVMAFGHGHLGLTLSAVTAAHAAALLADGPTPDRLRPYAIDRFQ